MSRISDICKYYNVGKDTIVNLLRYFPEYGRVIDSLSYKLNDTQIVIIDNFFKRDRRILEAASKILFRRKKGTNINYSSKILIQKELTDTPKNASIIKEKLNEILTEEKKDNILKELQNNKVENNYNRNVNDENKTSSKTFKEQMELLNYTYMNDLAREIMLLPQKIFNTYSLDVLPSKELIKNYFGYIDTMIKL